MHVFLNPYDLKIGVLLVQVFVTGLSFSTIIARKSQLLNGARLALSLVVLSLAVLLEVSGFSTYGTAGIAIYSFGTFLYAVLWVILLSREQLKMAGFVYGITILSVLSFLFFGPIRFHIGLG